MPDPTYNRVPGKNLLWRGNGYAKTSIVVVCSCVLLFYVNGLTSMAMSGRLVNLTKLFLDRLRPSCTYFRQ